MTTKKKHKHHHHHHKPTHPGKGPTPPTGGAGQPIFAQPAPSPDPTTFVDTTSDKDDYSLVDPTLLEPIPAARGGEVEPLLSLAVVLGDSGAAAVGAIEKSGQIVFHAVGDTGNSSGPRTQSLVADKMVSDFDEANPADVPSFFFHLGDIVYNFGEGAYYYDQFYEPYREYPAPIIALAGNHDGVVYRTDPAPTLEAYLRNFCAETPAMSSDAGGLLRSTMVQPGVFFTFDAPFVRILALYSNVLEDPGVISSEGNASSPVSDVQLAYLRAALSRAKSEGYAGAVVIAVHHPPYAFGTTHGSSPRMLQDIDDAANTEGFWPHAVISGHAHNYERFTRVVGSTQIPYIIGGCGGHNVVSLQSGSSGAVRVPMPFGDGVTFENYDDTDYGYLRIVANSETLRIEYHEASDGATIKAPDDVVTVNLKARTIS